MNIFFIFVTTSTVLHRLLLFSLPHNIGITTRPFSIMCSLLSDISLLVMVWTLTEVASIAIKNK